MRKFILKFLHYFGFNIPIYTKNSKSVDNEVDVYDKPDYPFDKSSLKITGISESKWPSGNGFTVFCRDINKE